MRPVSTVYLVTNVLNGHTYVGVTRLTPEQRWTQHLSTSRVRARTYLHRAIAKYGTQHFTIEAVASCLSREHAGGVERRIIQRLAPIYNQTNGGEVTAGRRGGPELYKRIAAKNAGHRRTPEQNAANRAQALVRWQSDPTFRAAALAGLERGRPNVDEKKRIAAVAQSARTRVWTTESRSKLSASCMGRVYGQDVIDRTRLKKTKPIYCPTLDMTFGCCEEAAIRLGVSTSSIYKVCGGARQSVDGLVLSYEADHAR